MVTAVSISQSPWCNPWPHLGEDRTLTWRWLCRARPQSGPVAVPWVPATALVPQVHFLTLGGERRLCLQWQANHGSSSQTTSRSLGRRREGARGGEEKGFAKASLNHFWLLSFTSCTKNKSFTLCSLLSAVLQADHWPLDWKCPRNVRSQTERRRSLTRTVSTFRWPEMRQVHWVTSRLRGNILEWSFSQSCNSPLVTVGQVFKNPSCK